MTALGTTGVVGVKNAPSNAALFALDCAPAENYVTTIFDYYVPTSGSPTPRQAIDKMLADDESAVVMGRQNPLFNDQIALLRADGTTRAVVTVERLPGGWVINAAESCSGEDLNPSRH